MARYDVLPSDARSSDADGYGSTDDLMRPCLRRAFPLPTDGPAADETFRRLLDALAQRTAKTQ